MTAETTPRRKTVLAEEVWHLPTYIVDDKPPNATGECSLFVRRYRLVETPKGEARIDCATDVWTFPDADAMVAAIVEHGVQELPAEADGDLTYVPDAVVVPDATVRRDFERIPLPGAVSDETENSHSQGVAP